MTRTITTERSPLLRTVPSAASSTKLSWRLVEVGAQAMCVTCVSPAQCSLSPTSTCHALQEDPRFEAHTRGLSAVVKHLGIAGLTEDLLMKYVPDHCPSADVSVLSLNVS